jgi:DNA-binding transcriptional ArsR family regulator
MMSDSTIDLILHPVRLRILLTMGDNRLTATQIARILPDVPQATLYRHINALADGGILQVVEENQVRGTVEKVYALPDASMINLTEEEFVNASKDDHMRYFTLFVASLLGDYSRYLQHTDSINMRQDGVGYHKLPIYMSDEELETFVRGLNELLQPISLNKPGGDRKRRMLATILMPDPDNPDVNE